MALQFKPDHEAGQALHDWWSKLEENKGDRAALRRCQEPTEALFVPAYHKLYHELSRYGRVNDYRLPVIAALTAHIKSLGELNQDVAVQMAAPRRGGDRTPTLSELRFRRLLQCQTVDELFPALRRVLALLDGKVNLYSLADSIYYWSDTMRRRWAYAYYGALKA